MIEESFTLKLRGTIKPIECDHARCKVIEQRAHCQGVDEVTIYMWCEECGALYCDYGGYKPSKWFIPRSVIRVIRDD